MVMEIKGMMKVVVIKEWDEDDEEDEEERDDRGRYGR